MDSPLRRFFVEMCAHMKIEEIREKGDVFPRAAMVDIMVSYANNSFKKEVTLADFLVDVDDRS